MTYSKRTYTAIGLTTAILALVVDQLLWAVTILTFGSGVIIGVAAPLLVGGIGVLTGASAIKHHGTENRQRPHRSQLCRGRSRDILGPSTKSSTPALTRGEGHREVSNNG